MSTVRDAVGVAIVVVCGGGRGGDYVPLPSAVSTRLRAAMHEYVGNVTHAGRGNRVYRVYIGDVLYSRVYSLGLFCWVITKYTPSCAGRRAIPIR